MEVMHASGPGARVRVMRAAYHSTAGPGAPTASCLMHSSRRVITSGFNLLEPPSFPSKPLEISSTPLDYAPEGNIETENYKVTEPDDFDISKPSNWRSCIGGSSVRMPSEESSSADNASIVDLDSRPNHNLSRKYSYDSENSDILSSKKSSRMSPLLDAPVALSTLKYKSLLNGSNDWNNRRKSYSFEDTSPPNETITHSNDTLAMESSTDSGICKSTEIVNGADDKPTDNFQNWLSKNRPNSFYKGNQMKNFREHDVVVEHPHENTIALQSKGKVSITVPIRIETEDEYKCKKSHMSDDDRKVKKVEFCKTELHFAAETGKVNIIATDEKPPPTNDFRKKRSAFVPIHSTFEKPITLFGEPNKEFPQVGSMEFPTFTNIDNELDENTAATKSILKNKIPKPKPYLLGENMAFGSSKLENMKEDVNLNSKVSGVTLINRNLQSRRYSDESISNPASDKDLSVIKNNVPWTTNRGPVLNDSLKQRRSIFESAETAASNYVKETKSGSNESVGNKLRVQLSPVQARARTRQLRDSDLTYFGLDKEPKTNIKTKPVFRNHKIQNERKTGIDDFHSVKLIQQISNSVCNSEAESEPDYQNLPLKTNFAPIPTPRHRTRILDPLIEQDSFTKVTETHRSRLSRQDQVTTSAIRSISEPPKRNSIERPRRHHIRREAVNASPETRLRNQSIKEENSSISNTKTPSKKHKDSSEESDPLYVNFSQKDQIRSKPQRDQIARKSHKQQETYNIITNSSDKEQTTEHKSPHKYNNDLGKENKVKEKKQSTGSESQRTHNSLKKRNHAQRTQKLSTPDYATERDNYDKESRRHKTSTEKVYAQKTTNNPKHEHRTRSLQRPNEINNTDNTENSTKDTVDVHINQCDTSLRARKPSKDKTGRKDKTYQKLSDTRLSENYHNSLNAKETNSTERILPKTDSAKIPNRNEIVINYDDKNGTVSSICKVKHGPGTTRRKKMQKETTDIPKDQKIKYNKTSDKHYLLQLPDHHWKQNGLGYGDRKWKSRMHVQRTCTLL